MYSTSNYFNQTDHTVDDDIILYVEEQIPITTNVSKILSLPEHMSKLLLSYLKNSVVRTIVQVRIYQLYNLAICNYQFTFSQ